MNTDALITYLTDYLNERDLKLISYSLMGSHLFHLANKNSDYDYLVTFAEPFDNYLSLNQPQSLTMIKFNNCDIQFMNIKRWFELAIKSNFTVLSSLYNPVYLSKELWIMKQDFSPKAVGHHLLGLINNPRQRSYMQFYSWLVLEYIIEHKVIPIHLYYQYLLANVSNLSLDEYDSISYALQDKKQGIKTVLYEPPVKYTHEFINTLPSVKVNINAWWLKFIKELK